MIVKRTLNALYLSEEYITDRGKPNANCFYKGKVNRSSQTRIFTQEIMWMLDRADNIFWDDNLRVDLIGEPKIASLSTWIGP